MGTEVYLDVCVVIPTYNEVGTISELVVSLLELDELGITIPMLMDYRERIEDKREQIMPTVYFTK